MSGKRIVQLVVSLLVGAGCLWLAFKNAPIDETQDIIGGAAWWGHAGFVGCFFVQLLIRSRRWAIQVEGVSGRPLPFREALAICSVSFAAVFLLPFRLGELVRPYLSAQRGLMSGSAGIANSAVERVVDGMVTTACFGVVLVLLADQKLPPSIIYGGGGALLLFGTASVVLVVGARWREPSIRFWRRLLSAIHQKLADTLVGILERFLDGLICFRGPRALLGYLGLSVMFWLLNGFGSWLLLRGLGIEVGPAAGYFTVCFMVIAVMIPAPPGNLGNFHAFAKLALTLLGVAAAPALAFAVLVHGWHVVLLLLWAGLFVALGDVSLERIRAAAASEDPAAPSAVPSGAAER